MIKLIKVSAHDCAICAQLAYHDVSIAEDERMLMEVVELGDLAEAVGSPVHNYIVSYHLEGDGSITVPIYMIMDDDKIQASSEVKDHTELSNLIDAWKTWKNAQTEN
jgi:hypothetical protein